MEKEYLTWDEKDKQPIDSRLCDQIADLWLDNMPEEYARSHTLRLIREYTETYRRAMKKFYHIYPKD